VEGGAEEPSICESGGAGFDPLGAGGSLAAGAESGNGEESAGVPADGLHASTTATTLTVARSIGADRL
jgi:hypothetical protein